MNSFQAPFATCTPTPASAEQIRRIRCAFATLWTELNIDGNNESAVVLRHLQDAQARAIRITLNADHGAKFEEFATPPDAGEETPLIP